MSAAPMAGTTNPEVRLGHAAADDLAVAERRPQVRRLPQRPRLDVFRLQRQPDVLACGAELGWVNRDNGQPTGGAALAV